MSGFWQGKRVVVTGGAGFLGSHLCEKLLRLGAEVIALDDESRGHNRIDGVTFVMGDAGDYDICCSVFNGCDAVFNLAAHVAGLLYNRSHHSEMFERNVRLQLTPVRAARAFDVPRFLQVSSVCVYAPEYVAGAVEVDGAIGEPVEGNAGYSWAKRIGERAVLWAGLPHCVIVRPSNMYGPRDYFDERAHVIPALIKKCLHENEIKVHGTGNEVREFLYVEDAANGMIAALEHGKPNEVYNLGTHGETRTSIADLVGLLQKLTVAHEKRVTFTGGDGGDPRRNSICEKIFDDTGWRYTTGLQDGLLKTVNWYVQEVSPI
jgi:nucleoside-diphosphate-sugar epimerase